MNFPFDKVCFKPFSLTNILEIRCTPGTCSHHITNWQGFMQMYVFISLKKFTSDWKDSEWNLILFSCQKSHSAAKGFGWLHQHAANLFSITPTQIPQELAAAGRRTDWNGWRQDELKLFHESYACLFVCLTRMKLNLELFPSTISLVHPIQSLRGVLWDVNTHVRYVIERWNRKKLNFITKCEV